MANTRAKLTIKQFGDPDWHSAIEEFLGHVRASQEENTRDMYAAQLRLLVNWMTEADVSLLDFKARDLDRYLGWRKEQPSKREPHKKISDSTRRKDALCCKVFIRFCFRRGIIDSDPLIDYKLPRGNRALPVCPTETEIRTLVNAIGRYWDPERNPKIRFIPHRRRNFYRTRNIAIIVGLAQTGAREGELLRLTLDDYKPKGLAITFRDTKTDEDREVPIKQEWVDLVADYLKWRPKEAPARALFVNDFGEALDTDVFGHTFRDLMKFAGLTGWSLHGLRHYAGTKLCDIAGIDKAQAILGHRSIATTQIYNHIGRASLSVG